MSKKPVTKKERAYARKIATKTVKTAKKREKLLIVPFNLLSNALEKEFAKSNKGIIEKLLKTVLQPSMQLQMFKTWKLNIDEFVGYFKDVWGRNITDEQIITVKSKILDRTLKKEVAKKVTNISDIVEKILNSRISEMEIAGMSNRDIQKEIVRITKGEIGTKRAELIAREETSQAISKTNFEVAKTAGMKKKKWIHVGGGKSNRPNHLAMDGVLIPIKSKFNVTGYKTTPPAKMDRPKDNTAPAGQVINCYCQVFYY